MKRSLSLRTRWSEGFFLNAPYSHHFEVAPVRTHDVVATCPNQSALSLPQPHLHVLVLTGLKEVLDEVHQIKLHHKVSNLLAAHVLGFSNVGTKVLFHYGILVPEVCQYHLQFR